tara:strand:+ start:73 stop:366 length:294 start_codon:yes stop_codon:yes gene_type:complete
MFNIINKEYLKYMMCITKEVNMKIEKILKEMSVLEEGHELLVVKNPYSGVSIKLTPQAEGLYSYITGCESMGLYENMNVATSYFREHYPKEYMILLD